MGQPQRLWGNPQKPWTADETLKLRQLWDQGLTHTQVADALGREPPAVQTKCLRLGLRREASTFWTPEREQMLRDLWAGGKPFSFIAQALGCSRSGAVGKAYRLGLRNKTVLREPKAKSAKSGKRVQRVAPTVVVELPVPINFKGVSLGDLAFGMCRYPQGEGGNTLFCGNDVVPETSWCPTCSGVVFSRRAA